MLVKTINTYLIPINVTFKKIIVIVSFVLILYHEIAVICVLILTDCTFSLFCLVSTHLHEITFLKNQLDSGIRSRMMFGDFSQTLAMVCMIWDG